MAILFEEWFVATTARFILNGCEDLTTFHYRCSAGPGVNIDLQQFYSAFETDLSAVAGHTDRYAACISSDVEEITWSIQVVTPTRYIKHPFTPTIGGAGTGPAVAMPQNVSVGMSLRADLAVPAGRGTKHMGAVPAEWVVEGLVVEPGISAYQVLLDLAILTGNLSIDGHDVPYQPVLFHRATPTSSLLVTNGFVGTTSRVARRRTVGLGS